VGGGIPIRRSSVEIISSFYLNRSTFEKDIEKIPRGPDFMEHGVVTAQINNNTH